MTTINHHIVLDVRHEDSPVPTIRTKEILDTMEIGYVLKVITSKESTIKNLRTLVANNPYELIHHSKVDTDFIFFIRKIK